MSTASAPTSDESPHAATPTVLFITVQYNNPADTHQLVQSLAQFDDSANCELVIVDNSTVPPTDGDKQALAERLSWPTHILRTDKNLYYWGGASFALKSLYGEGRPLPHWIVVCNNDLTIEDPLFVRKIRSLDPAKYPIIAPRVTSVTTGKEQNPMLDRPPGILKRLKWRAYDVNYRSAKTLLFIHGAGSKMLRKLGRQSSKNDARRSPRKIYAPHGACMIFSFAFFELGGELDTTVPMYAEEMTIAALAKKLRMPVWFYPYLQVFHREHSTTGIHLTPAKYEMERSARRHYYQYRAALGTTWPGGGR